MPDSELLELERRFWMGDADFYRQLLTADCRMALPGMGLVERQVAIDGIASGPRWDEVEFTQARLQRLGSDYSREDGHWKLAYHHQTARSPPHNGS